MTELIWLGLIRVTRYRDTELQRYKDTELQRYRVTRKQSYKGFELQENRVRVTKNKQTALRFLIDCALVSD